MYVKLNPGGTVDHTKPGKDGGAVPNLIYKPTADTKPHVKDIDEAGAKSNMMYKEHRYQMLLCR